MTEISLKLSDRIYLKGVWPEGKCPQDGAKIIADIENSLESDIERLVESTFKSAYVDEMKKTCKNHLKATGEFPKYFAMKVLATHNLNTHKANMEFLDFCVELGLKVLEDEKTKS